MSIEQGRRADARPLVARLTAIRERLDLRLVQRSGQMHMGRFAAGLATIPAVPGHDVHLTIDAAVQAKIQALMDPKVGLAKLQDWHRSTHPEQWPKIELGAPIYGAAVVLEIDTGEVMALVSTPSFTRSWRYRSCG